MALTLTEGRDTYCRDSLQPGRCARGVELLAQRLYHRLITPPGTLRGGEEEADFGMDLAAMVGEGDDATNEKVRPAEITNELRKDPCVDNVTVKATRTEAADKTVSWLFAIHVESSEGPFDLLVEASAVTVELLKVSA